MTRRTGKIARFPKDLRELVNNMLDDGAQYTSIIHELDKHRQRWPDGVNEITVNNLSNWHNGGYQDWVHRQEMAADLRSHLESFAELMDGPDPNKLHEMVLHVGIAQLYRLVTGLNRDTIEALSTNDPATFARLLTVFQRFSQHALEFQKLKLQAARQQQPTALESGFQPKALPSPASSDALKSIIS